MCSDPLSSLGIAESSPRPTLTHCGMCGRGSHGRILSCFPCMVLLLLLSIADGLLAYIEEQIWDPGCPGSVCLCHQLKWALNLCAFSPL